MEILLATTSVVAGLAAFIAPLLAGRDVCRRCECQRQQRRHGPELAFDHFDEAVETNRETDAPAPSPSTTRNISRVPCGRACGLFCKHAEIIDAMAACTSGLASVTGRGVCDLRDAATSCTDLRVNGGRPVSSSYAR